MSDRVELKFHTEALRLVLDNVSSLEKSIRARLTFSKKVGDVHTVTMTEMELLGYLSALATAIDEAKDEETRDELQIMFDVLAEQLECETAEQLEDLESSGAVGNLLRSDPIQAFQAEAREFLEQNPSISMEEANAHMDRISDEFNHAPLDYFQGLSPYQVRCLLDSDWTSADSGLRVSEDLSFEELEAASTLFSDARLFLTRLRDQGGTRATPGGNMNRKFTHDLSDEMKSFERHPVLEAHANELELHTFAALRHTLQFGGLLRKVKNTFVVTKKGEKLLEPKHAGELYALLIRTLFTKYELASMDGCPELPDVQDTLPYTLYVISQRATTPIPEEDLVQILFIPAVAEAIADMSRFDTMAGVLARIRIIDPLVQFGLLKLADSTPPKTADDGDSLRPNSILKTGLFDKVVLFNIDDREDSHRF